MAIYVIADLHLSFEQNKPMDIFGDNWENHAEKIRKSWLDVVKEDDYVIVPGDFSWATYLENTKKDFEYLNNLPGYKIMLKGNHDYWWTTVTNMRNFLEENKFKNIDFIYNNSYLVENKILTGTRGWNLLDTENSSKMIKRESIRLQLAIEDGIKKYGDDKEIIVFMHYPPISNTNKKSDFLKILKQYDIKRCYYGHLHGKSHQDAVEGIVDGIEFKLISADYLNFDVIKVT